MPNWSDWTRVGDVLTRDCGDWYIQINWWPVHKQAMVWVGHGRAGIPCGFRTNAKAIRGDLPKVKRMAMQHYRDVRAKIMLMPEGD